ncbi:hypothetical protein Taro_026858, partial [Colocasia esculenta]|nr:hypothetical protein [Colocasia esculenta]
LFTRPVSHPWPSCLINPAPRAHQRSRQAASATLLQRRTHDVLPLPRCIAPRLARFRNPLTCAASALRPALASRLDLDCGSTTLVVGGYVLLWTWSSGTGLPVAEEEEGERRRRRRKGCATMGERKVLNKYYPPDFDPAKIPRRRQPKNQQIKVRMMLPMSIRCNTCGTYIYKGTKFNSRKEDAVGEVYLGIQVFRFYFKCTRCSAELTFKTDPQNNDYVVESGASRNFEPWREEEELAEKEKRKREAEEMGDAMKSLENRALDSKMDMDILAALEEMKSMKSRHATVNSDLMLEALRRSKEAEKRKLEEEDEELIKKYFHDRDPADFVRRIDDDDDDDAELNEDLYKGNNNIRKDASRITGNPTDSLTTDTISNNSKSEETSSSSGARRPKSILQSSSVIVSIAKKPRISPAEGKKLPHDDQPKDALSKPPEVNTSLLSLCQSYNSDDE